MVLEQPLELVGGVEGIVLYRGGSQQLDGIKRHHVLGAVGHDDGDPIARPDAKGLKARGGCAHLGV